MARLLPTVVTVQPSSVIFLVVIAIWAAYLVQHWVGRREHLATARTVDRFSESMRILDRSQGRTDVAATEPASASSARVHRRGITVTRAGAEGDPADFTRGAGRRLADRVTSSARAAASAESRDAATQSARQAGERAREFGSRTVGSVSAATARAAARTRSSGAMGTGRRPVFGRATRGVLVIGALVFTLVATLLASFGAVGWRWPVLGLAGTGAAMWWLRRAVAAATARRRRPGAARPSAARTSTRAHADGAAARTADRARATTGAGRMPQAARVAAPRRPAEVADSARRQPVIAEPAGPLATTSDAASPAGTGVYDIDALAPAPVVQAQAAATETPGGWSPVPVPPPTYTLKAKATYPAGEVEVEDAEDDVVSPYATVTDVTDYAAQRARLASG